MCTCSECGMFWRKYSRVVVSGACSGGCTCGRLWRNCSCVHVVSGLESQTNLPHFSTRSFNAVGSKLECAFVKCGAEKGY